MGQRGSLMATLPFVGLMVLMLWPALGSAPAPPPSLPAPSSAPPVPTETVRAATGPIGPAQRALCDFWFLDDAACRSLSADQHRAEVVIATLPDPLDSRYAYNFDRFADAIQRAAETGQYLLDRFVLPWRAEAEKGDAPHRSEPGLLLFRSRRGATPLAVLLVGELPTTGVQRVALSRALDLAERLQPARAPLRILGPSFSGTQHSLVRGIRKWRASPGLRPRAARAVQIVSGTATAVRPNQLGDHTTFRATAIRDGVAFGQLLHYLGSTWPADAPPKIAVLTEANTAYGRQRLPSSSTADARPAHARRVPFRVLKLVFPLHISQLRSTYARERPTTSPSATALPIALEQTGAPEDSLPALSRLEVHTAETALAQILDSLDRERFDYVGLLASDVRDRLFLARHIRQHCPSTGLFAFGADILYLNPGENPYLAGMLVVTPYPLFAPNQTWTYPFEGSSQRWQAASSTAQGVYNALLLLLGDPDDLLEYGQPFATPGANDARYPALWLSVVGRNALWPLATFDVARVESERGYLAPARTRGVRAPGAGTQRNSAPTVAILVLAAAAVCVGLIGIVSIPFAAGVRRGRLEQIVPILADPSSPSERFDHRAHALVALTSLAVPTIMLAAAAVTLDRWSPWVGPMPQPLWLAVLGAAAIVVAVAVAAVSALTALPSWWRAQPSDAPHLARIAGVLATLGGSTGALALSLWAAGSWWGGTPPDDTATLFRTLRVFELPCGLNPLVPLALVGLVGFLWGLSMLARVRLMASLQGCERFLDFGDQSLGGAAAHEQRMQDALVFGFHALPAWPWLIPAAILADAAVWQWLAPGLEGSTFDALFRAVFFAMSFAIIVTFLRFLWLWQELRQMLASLACHPMVEAYQRLPSGMSWSPVLGWTGRHSALAGLGYAVERLGLVVAAMRGEKKNGEERATRSEAAEPEEAPDADLDAIEDASRQATAALREAATAQSAGRHSEAQRHQRDLQVHLGSACRRLIPLLERRWPEIGREVKEDKRGEVVARGEELVATRVAIFVQVGVTHARNLAGFVIAALVLMLMAAISYPFQPRALFLGYHWAAILAVVVLTVTAFAEMGRDRILSYLAHTTPGALDWNREWIVRLVVYGLVPILTLLAAQFPEVGAGFLGLLRTAIGALSPVSGLSPG